jgi:hypothetical protein
MGERPVLSDALIKEKVALAKRAAQHLNVNSAPQLFGLADNVCRVDVPELVEAVLEARRERDAARAALRPFAEAAHSERPRGAAVNEWEKTPGTPSICALIQERDAARAVLRDRTVKIHESFHVSGIPAALCLDALCLSARRALGEQP